MKRRTLFAAALLLPSLLVTAPQAQAAQSCQAARPRVPGAEVVSVTAVEKPGGTVESPIGLPPVNDVPPYCEVTVMLTHPGAHDNVKVLVWLPVTGWTGRFLGAGGGGYAMNLGDSTLAVGVKRGFASANTDGGVGFDINTPAAWAGDKELVKNFASRSLHDMAVAGKAVTASYYGKPAKYAYWDGCSTGGRQGMVSAQRFPDDYDGINADAPAINWDRFVPADLWPQIVMYQEHNLLSQCEFKAFEDAAVAACDPKDGVVDGVIDLPGRCDFTAAKLVGKKITCDGKEITISLKDAQVMQKIWEGPRQWYGLDPGTSLASLGNTVPGPDGKLTGVPFEISETWVQYFVKQNPSFDVKTMTYRDFERVIEQSRRFNDIIGTDDPDLSAFRDSGGKLITWHGQVDSLIPYKGTVDYRQRVERALGGASKVDKFYRLFLVPGADHCFFGPGELPVDPLGQLVDWVEKGVAPDTLLGQSVDGARTRNLCKYPLVSRYDGHGDPNNAASFSCRRW